MAKQALITGAAGGMGRACARLFGAAHDLILTDVAAGPLDLFAAELRDEGYRVRGVHGGDLGSDAVLAALAADIARDTPLSLIHTAGIAPSQGTWGEIMTVNLVATEKLLQEVEPLLAPGSAAVLIASVAGHMLGPLPEAEAVMDAPLAPDLIARLTPLVDRLTDGGRIAGASGLGYSLSKQALIRLCERRAAAWGARGARIVSISPGVTMTPMGHKEIADTPGTAHSRDAAPAGRAGTPMDIALAARFLASDDAGFISGCDLRVDGGTIAAIRT